MLEFLWKTAIWLITECAVFNIVVIFLFRTRLVFSARDEKGEMKRKQTPKGWLAIAGFLILILFALFEYDWFLLPQSAGMSFGQILLINFIFLILLVLYDSFVIDLLIIGKWRPDFLHIPKEMTFNEQWEHVKKTFIFGWIFIIPLTAISAVVFTLIY